eukprot:s795_g13.t1
MVITFLAQVIVVNLCDGATRLTMGHNRQVNHGKRLVAIWRAIEPGMWPFLTFKIAQALQMTPGRVSVICDDKVWTEPEIQLKDFWKEGCTLTMLETPAWGVARLETLKAKFLKHGKLEKEADGCRRHDAELPDGLALPSILVELMKMGAKWTFKDLFHLEMFVLTDEANLDIFGDEECRDDWREEHGDDNCANTWWLCIGNSSEYDYYYVNAKEDSPDFGQVRHIVNNCDEESIYTQAPFDNFLDAVERYVDAQERLQTDSDDEGKNFSEYNRAPNGCKPRKRLRL